MRAPEYICPRCGCGMESGWQYASCADFPENERAEAHSLFCKRFALDVCSDCAAEEGWA